MMKQNMEKLLSRIDEHVGRFAKRIVRARSSLRYASGNAPNETFILKFYGGFTLDDSGEEIAIVVEARREGGMILIESDICLDNGVLLEIGPSAQFHSESSPEIWTAAVSRWEQEFAIFLRGAEQAVLDATGRLDR